MVIWQPLRHLFEGELTVFKLTFAGIILCNHELVSILTRQLFVFQTKHVFLLLIGAECAHPKRESVNVSNAKFLLTYRRASIKVLNIFALNT